MKNTIKPNFYQIKNYPTLTKSNFLNFRWLNAYFPVEHIHTPWEVLICVQGEIKHTLNGETQIMTRGDACLLRPLTDAHSINPVSPHAAHQHFSFTLPQEALAPILAPYPEIVHTTIKSSAPLYFSLSDSFLSELETKMLIVQNMEQPHYANNILLAFHQILLSLFGHILNKRNAYPDWLSRFLDDIRSPLNFDKRIETLAKLTPYSYANLTRVFKEYLGTTLGEYITRTKMMHAKRLLCATKLSMIEICMELGYEGLSTLNHNFKRAFH